MWRNGEHPQRGGAEQQGGAWTRRAPFSPREAAEIKTQNDGVSVENHCTPYTILQPSSGPTLARAALLCQPLGCYSTSELAWRNLLEGLRCP